MESSSSSCSRPHFVLVPLMAQGHMIPMTDMALLLAARGSLVTYVTTPVNAARISTAIAHAKRSRLPIEFVLLDFPAAQVGLPEGTESVDLIPSLDLFKNFADATSMLRRPLLLHLRNHRPPPTCIISDNIHYWTHSVARELGIPRLVFHGFGCFPLLCIRNSKTCCNLEARDENEPFVIPGLPDEIEITRARLPSSLDMPILREHLEGIREAELNCSGVVVNSFHDLEPSYIERYASASGKNVWTIGPLSLCSRDVSGRGNSASLGEDLCLKWLDSMRLSSVIFVSFGSLAQTNPAQLQEIGQGLEASDCPFVWVIKAKEDENFSEWLSEYKERNKERGLVIRGWAPQVMILSHPAVGGFMTHCGWNSTLESISLGVPMITWPHFGDQFLNEKLVVEVLRVGVDVGVKEPTGLKLETHEVMVKSGDVERAVRRLILMDEGGEMRSRAKELSDKAKMAVEEGGSSYSNLTDLIQKMGTNNSVIEGQI